MTLLNRFLNWLCVKAGICLRFNGDLLTPEAPDDPFWYK